MMTPFYNSIGGMHDKWSEGGQDPGVFMKSRPSRLCLVDVPLSSAPFFSIWRGGEIKVWYI